MKKSFHILLFATSVFLLFSLSGCKEAPVYHSLESSLPTMNIQGEGLAEAVPDMATAVFGVISDDTLLAKAYKDNTERMNAVLNEIKNMGVEEKDIRTSSYSVTPVYPRDENGRIIPGKPASYRVSQELTVRIRDLAKTGEVIDRTMAAGVNTFRGLSFTSSRMDELELEAKELAAKDAGVKARSLSEAMGVRTGRIIRLGHSAVTPQPRMMTMALEAAPARTVPQVGAGTIEVRATCEVVYEIIQ